MASDLPEYVEFEPQASRFLQLPAELRNSIYRHVMMPDRAGKYTHIHILPCNQSCTEYRWSNLLRVCRQTRFEASSIFYEENCFEAALTYAEADRLRSWLDLIGIKNVKRLAHLRIRYCPDQGDGQIILDAMDSHAAGEARHISTQGSAFEGIHQRQQGFARDLVGMLVESGVNRNAITAPDVKIGPAQSQDASYFRALVDLHWKWVMDTTVSRQAGSNENL